ncbi:hypothetical protein HPB48_011139 [Haemaphysalis longicornis]|uniref:PiggyBac transposable element-derived protein domain-containing protein n=1 Tax=Haemaphysalis longicornis TaxID=44386 RepID=A0A9J6G8Z1_HAELO|nr:hypothetical protein HPB48_011139 [Haemaphysalis longicornis]
MKDTLKQQYGVTGAIVLQLADRISSEAGHKLYFDLYFTSLPLLRPLPGKKYLPREPFAPMVMNNSRWSQRKHSRKKTAVRHISWLAQIEN